MRQARKKDTDWNGIFIFFNKKKKFQILLKIQIGPKKIEPKRKTESNRNFDLVSVSAKNWTD